MLKDPTTFVANEEYRYDREAETNHFVSRSDVSSGQGSTFHCHEDRRPHSPCSGMTAASQGQWSWAQPFDVLWSPKSGACGDLFTEAPDQPWLFPSKREKEREREKERDRVREGERDEVRERKRRGRSEEGEAGWGTLPEFFTRKGDRA